MAITMTNRRQSKNCPLDHRRQSNGKNPEVFFVLDGLCHGAHVFFQPLRGQRAQQGEQESLKGLSHEMNNFILELYVLPLNLLSQCVRTIFKFIMFSRSGAIFCLIL